MAELRAGLLEAASTRRAGSTRKYRPELQGLRALACLLVVVYHIWLGRVSGGVDVFFLISGFLITGQLIRASARGGIEFRPMWGRMFKRLFPAALTVLLAAMVAGMLWLPQHRWLQTIKEAVASALYLENWRLAADSVDYFAQHNTASPLQHFWSLSIQGQFYLVWPLLIALVALVARKARRSLQVSVAVALVTLFASSLALSVWLTAVNQPLAYFSSLTRVWEFALGGLLALVIERVALRRGLRIVFGWAGVASLVACGLVLQVGTVFPGYLALWPTLAAAMVIVAGATESRLGADRLLSSRPLEYLGNISYALYLWHWPVLVFYLVLADRAHIGLIEGTGLIGLSLLLAALTYHLVEQPVRLSAIGADTRWGAYRFAVLSLVPVLVLAGSWQVLSLQRVQQQALAFDDPDHPGARAHTPGFAYAGTTKADLAPSFIALADDWARIDEQHCVLSPRGAELQVCSTEVDGPPTRRIVVVGDSHAQQLLGALVPIAHERNWQVTSMVRSFCPFTTDSDTRPDDQGCLDWNAAVAEEIVAMRPDAVITMGTRDVRVGLTEYTPDGYLAQWRKLEEAGIPVVAVRDNPRYDFSPSACVEANGPDAEECSTPRAELLASPPPYAELPDVPGNVRFVDLSDYLCDPQRCSPVIGNVLVYVDDNHVSATYMRTMAPIIEQEVDTALGWTGERPAPA